jgi:hypothetical protein
MVGYEMVCESPSPVEPGKRIFGGRDWVQKPCIPEDCTDFQTKQCTFGGSIHCMIPGLKGMGVWIVPTTSWYSIKAVKNTLNLVWKATGGRIAHLLHEGETIFVLRKVRGKVSAIDKEGNTSLKEQYLISLDVTIDPLELVKEFSPLRITRRGASALAAITDASLRETTDAPAPALTVVEFGKKEETETDKEEPAMTGDKKEAPMAESTTEKGRADTKETPKATGQQTPCTPPAGNKDALTTQREAIRKQARRLACIPEDRISTRISAIASSREAETIIRQLNKGNYAAFVTLTEAKVDLKRAVSAYGLAATQTEPVISGVETTEEACELLMRLNRGDFSPFLSTDSGDDDRY